MKAVHTYFKTHPEKAGTVRLNWLQEYSLLVRKQRTTEGKTVQVKVAFETAEEMKEFLTKINITNSLAKLYNQIIKILKHETFI